jgi:hypothetical protein
MTIEFPASSLLAQHDVVYAQYYASSKEPLDAFKQFPFSNQELLDLTLDREVFVANTQAGGETRRTWEGRVRSWEECKARCCDALDTEREKDLGTRIEFRLGWLVLEALEEYALEQEQEHGPPSTVLAACPESTWSLSTASYLGFLKGTYQKYTSAIEIIRVTSPTTGVTLERTKLMWMLMLCLPLIISGRVRDVPGLWKDTDPGQGEIVRGLGWSSTLQRHGYAWWTQIVDWERFQFLPELTNGIQISGRNLKNWYASSLHLIRDTNNTLDMCIDLLQQFQHSPCACQDILQLMAHVGFRQFRLDTLKNIEDEIRAKYQEKITSDEITLCYSSLAEVLIDDIHLTRGGKTKYKDPHVLYNVLWGVDKQAVRKCFDKWAYRGALRKTREILQEYPQLMQQWNAEHEREFWNYHTLVLYPSTTTGCMKAVTKGSERMWFGVRRTGKVLAWLGRDLQPQMSPIPPYPTILSLEREEIVKRLENFVSQGR